MQQLRQQQVKGQLGESLSDDILSLYQSNKFFDEPVDTKDELPLTGNHDGDTRVVKSESKSYIWSDELNKWLGDRDIYTKTLSSRLVLGIDAQTEIKTHIPVGVIDGIVSIDTVSLTVNGVEQIPSRDYDVKIDTDFSCVIEWKSKDFQLEISDTINLSYDVLKLS